jgi:trigger factor
LETSGGTVKVSAQKIPDSQVVLEIEVEPERVEKALDRAYRRLVTRTRVPGFRPGKAPRAMLERYLGRDALLREALDRLVPEVYQEATRQEEVEPIDLPELEVVTTEPLVVKATVPVRPAIDLGDYRQVRVLREPVEVPQEKVERALEDLRRRYAVLEPVDRPVQWGDILRADVIGTVGDVTIVDQKDVEFRLREGQTVSLPGFAERLLGLTKGVETEVEISVPADFSDLGVAGKTARYRVVIHEIKEEKLPPLDDGFARQVGEGFPSLAALRERIESDIRQVEEEVALHRYHDQILAALEERATLEFPPVLVEREVERLLRDEVRTSGAGLGRPLPKAEVDERDLERYLRVRGKSEEELRQELRPLAVERVRRSLILTRVAEAENIDVSDADIDQEVERLVSSAGAQAEGLRRLFAGADGRDALRRRLLTRGTLDRLVSIASGEGASDGEEEGRAAAAAAAEEEGEPR